MKRQIYLLIGLALLVSAGVLSACQAETAVSAPELAATATPDTAVYQEKLDAAEAAYQSGQYEDALSLAQEAARLNPGNNTAWNLYRQASVAAAGDAYLRNLPDHRYRKDTLHFLADQANGMDYFIIDVREPDEYAADHIENAVNIPLRRLLQDPGLLPESKSTPILLYCHTQKRATHALVVLRELGYSNVWNLDGGWAAYQEWTANNPMPTPGPTATPEPELPSC